MARIAAAGDRIGERLARLVRREANERAAERGVGGRRFASGRGGDRVRHGDRDRVRGAVAAGVGRLIGERVGSDVVRRGRISVRPVRIDGERSVARVAAACDRIGERLARLVRGEAGEGAAERGVGGRRLASGRGGDRVRHRDRHRVRGAVAAGVGRLIGERVGSDVIRRGRISVGPVRIDGERPVARVAAAGDRIGQRLARLVRREAGEGAAERGVGGRRLAAGRGGDRVRHRDRHRVRGAVAARVGRLIGERVGTDVVRRGRVGVRSVGVHGQRSVGRSAYLRVCQSLPRRVRRVAGERRVQRRVGGSGLRIRGRRHHVGDRDGHRVRGAVAARIGRLIGECVGTDVVRRGRVGVGSVRVHGQRAVGRSAYLRVCQSLPRRVRRVAGERRVQRRVGGSGLRIRGRRHHVGDRDGHRVRGAVAAGVGRLIGECVGTDVVRRGRIGVGPVRIDGERAVARVAAACDRIGERLARLVRREASERAAERGVGGRRFASGRGGDHVGDRDGHRVRGAVAARVGRLIGERVGTDVVRRGRVGVRSVGVHGQRSVGRSAYLRVCQSCPAASVASLASVAFSAVLAVAVFASADAVTTSATVTVTVFVEL